MSLVNYREVKKSLVASEMVRIDCNTDEIYIMQWFQHSAPKNTNHYKGTRTLVDKILSIELREVVSADLDERWIEVLNSMQPAKRAEAALATGIAASRLAQCAGNDPTEPLDSVDAMRARYSRTR